jgi:hypothetical protein
LRGLLCEFFVEARQFVVGRAQALLGTHARGKEAVRSWSAACESPAASSFA